MKTREDKIFNAVGHAVMLVLSAAAVIPIILMVISSPVSYTHLDVYKRQAHNYGKSQSLNDSVE